MEHRGHEDLDMQNSSEQNIIFKTTQISAHHACPASAIHPAKKPSMSKETEQSKGKAIRSIAEARHGETM